MTLFANVVGFSLFGLLARVGHLGIQRRNIFDSAYPQLNPTNHFIPTIVLIIVLASFGV